MLPGRALFGFAGALTVLGSGYWLMRGQKKPLYCAFCNPSDLAHIVFEDENFIAFHDRKPDAALHLLVVPRKHYGTVKELTTDDQELVIQMLSLGQRLLREAGFSEEKTRFGFHVPPFNSVHHLHMHCLGLPFKPRYAELMFPKDGGRGFILSKHLIERLEKTDVDMKSASARK
ncbi:hypothetical protein EV177_006014 [Coemansia sp. RSA 1804]|nr:hypothetical protein EV177_006014 [Coemansia sp. RSA 1804]